MKSFARIIFILAGIATYHTASAQNVSINILTQNSGVVTRGRTSFLEVAVNNTDPNAYVGIFKIQVKISVPADIVSIPDEGHSLPTGWTITSNTGSTITLSNGKNMIASRDGRTILIALQGKKTGGPSTITGQLSFSTGESPGTAPGSLSGDSPADNSSTTTIKVLR